MSCFPSSLRLSSPVPSPRPSHLCTSLLALSLFSPLFHRTAVLLPSLRLSVSLSLSDYRCLFICLLFPPQKPPGQSSVCLSLCTFFFFFFLPLFLNLSQLFFFFLSRLSDPQRSIKERKQILFSPPRKKKKRESRRFFFKKKSVQLLVLTSCPNRVSVRPALRHPGGVNEGRNTGMEGLYLVGGVKRVLRGMIRAL